MPSPIDSTVPTSARSVSTSYCSIRSLRIDVISSGRSFNSAPYEVAAEALEAAAHARIHAARADLEHDSSDQVRVDGGGRFDFSARCALDLAEDRAQLVLGELDGGRQLDGGALLLARDEPFELSVDVVELGDAVLVDEETQEVPDDLVGVAQQVFEDLPLRARVELGVAQELAQLRHVAHRLDELRQLVVHLREPIVLLRRLEQRL